MNVAQETLGFRRAGLSPALSLLMYQRNRLDEAIPLLERSVSVHPEEPEFHNNLGLALAAANRHDDAIDAYRRVLALKPDHAEKGRRNPPSAASTRSGTPGSPRRRRSGP